jgi:hypothetical protein
MQQGWEQAPQHAEQTHDHVGYRSSTPKGAPVVDGRCPSIIAYIGHR